MTKLYRTLSGGMKIENSIKLDDLKDVDCIQKNLISPKDILHFEIKELTIEDFEKVKE